MGNSLGMGDSYSDIKDVKVSHIKAIDTQGSIIIYIEGRRERKVAALKGTPIYELGKRLAEISECDKYISHEVVKVAHPSARFYFEGRLSERMKDMMAAEEDEEEEEEKVKDIAMRDDVSEEETVTVSSNPEDIEAGATVIEEEKEEKKKEDEEVKTPEFTDQDLVHIEAVERAAHQHFVCRAVSHWPVVTMKPFVNEFFSRFVDVTSPYTIFSEDVYMVFRLWMNTGVCQSSLVNSIVQFLQAKDRLGPMWSIDTLEGFLMCHMYNEYEQIFPELESSLTISRWGDKYAEDENNLYASNIYKTYQRRSRIIAMREIQRLWLYYQEKNALARSIYSKGGKNQYQFRNPIEGVEPLMLDGIRIAPDIAKGKERSREDISYKKRDITEEQRILRDVLETIATVSSKRVDCWEKFMDPMRKLMIEVRDICNQVALNQIRQQNPEEILDYDTSYLRFQAGKVVPDVPPPTNPGVMETVKSMYAGESGSEDATVPIPSSPSPGIRVEYDPEIPHLPLKQLQRLLLYLDLAERSLLHAFKTDDPKMRDDVHHPDYEGYGEGSEYAQEQVVEEES
jgi:hypothetical protein